MVVKLNNEAIEALFKDPTGPIGQIIEKKAYAVENAAKQLLLIPGSGRLYTTYFFYKNEVQHAVPYGNRPPHRASAPGEPPASDTGTLLNSITHRMEVEDTVVAHVVAKTKYAIYLEMGTRYMEPRPFLRPALVIGMES